MVKISMSEYSIILNMSNAFKLTSDLCILNVYHCESNFTISFNIIGNYKLTYNFSVKTFWCLKVLGFANLGVL